ncbi:hypothetical protein Leryth_023085, partial [Lithospermum erythrorhizon]
MRNINPSIWIQNLSLVALLLMLLSTTTQCHKPYKFTYHHGKEIDSDGHGHMYQKGKEVAKGEIGMELYPTGSNLPDCTHACGPCTPCIRVMISFTCAVESCPVVYRCSYAKGEYYICFPLG